MMAQSLPSPTLSIHVELEADGAVEPDFSSLPAKPGVIAIEDETGGTLALATTANLRRMVTTKFTPIAQDAAPSRRVNYRSVARRVLAVRVGSAFEADWAYLQLARQRLPASYRGLLDHWQPWFIECEPNAAFPQWIKTVHPKVSAGAASAIGPFADKHAAGRYIEMMQDAFDLCRYHHLLVLSPKAVACVYKEMGRCPAPCDGTISMDAYRRKMQEAIDFACTPIGQWRTRVSQAMNEVGGRLEFETAQRLRAQLDRTAPAIRAEFAHVNRLERFAFIAIMPGETPSFARLFLIRGGWIEPIIDVPVKAEQSQIDAAVDAVQRRAAPQPADFSNEGIENIGMVCRHLFRPRKTKVAGSFLRWPNELTTTSLRKSLRALDRSVQATPPDDAIVEHDAENVADAGDRR